MPRRIVVPPSLLAVARRQAGLVSSAQCDEHLVLRGARARLVASGRWRRLTTGVLELLDATEQLQSFDDRRLRSAWLAMLAYGPEAIAVGACALALHGVAGLPVRIQPQVALPAGRPLRPRDGIRVRHFDGFARVAQGGRELACLDDALVQALPELHRLPAVAVLDNVLNRRLIDEARLAIVRERLRGRRGAAAVDEWWHLVDGRAESPLETEARLRCLDDGIPPDDLQVRIFDDDDVFVARGDLGWRLRDGRWLLVEIDGREVHDAPQALYGDRARQNRLLATGQVDLLRFIRADFRRSAFVATIRAHLAADAARDLHAPTRRPDGGRPVLAHAFASGTVRHDGLDVPRR